MALWVLTLYTQGFSFPHVNSITSYFLIILNAFFFAMGYLAWNVGIIKGNMPILVMLSYFSPMLSSAFSVIVLHSSLSTNFWYGAIIVTIGSLICWLSIRKNQVQQTKLAT